MIGIGKNLFKGNVKSGGAVVYDADALAYFTANTAITSAADKNAINTFYLGLKSDGIYTKIKAMYLPIWGSAAASKWNLVNPLDTNAAFRLNFATGMTFNSGGITSNGTSGYADTFFNVTSNLGTTSQHISIYSRSNNQTANTDIGAGTSSGGDYYNLIRLRNASNIFLIGMGNTNFPTASNTDSRGFYLVSKISGITANAYKNSTKIINNDIVNSGQSNNNISICGLNYNGTVIQFTTRQYSFVSIGDGLTDGSDSTNFYSRVQTLMTYFGINV